MSNNFRKYSRLFRNEHSQSGAKLVDVCPAILGNIIHKLLAPPSERGSQLLEQALIIPIICMLSMTAVDLSNVFRAYNSISSAAERVANELGRSDRSGAKVSPDTLSRSCVWTHFSWDADGVYLKQSKIPGYSNCEAPPSLCGSTNPYKFCSRRFKEFQGGSAPKFEFDYLKAVVDKGKSELLHLMPGVTFDCQQAGCASFNPSIDTNLDDYEYSLNNGDTQFLNVTITYKQPVLWLFNHPVELSYTAQERIQTDLIDRRVFMPNGCVKGMDCSNPTN